jgi:hypothetical protein
MVGVALSQLIIRLWLLLSYFVFIVYSIASVFTHWIRDSMAHLALATFGQVHEAERHVSTNRYAVPDNKRGPKPKLRAATE